MGCGRGYANSERRPGRSVDGYGNMVHERYELMVIGAGAAGSTAAKMAARAGRKVALIEKDALGGTCLNYGCDPTKFLLHAAHVLHRTRNARDYGLTVPAVEWSWSEVVAQVRARIARVRGGSHADAVTRQEARGIDVVLGEAAFVDAHTIVVNDQTLQADKFILATGYANAIPPIPGLQETGYITNRQAVVLEPFPPRLAILGAGPVGIEFAQIFARFGSEVTVLERAGRILAKDDEELTAQLHDYLESTEGIAIECGAEIERVEGTPSGKTIHWRRGSDDRALHVDEILVAAGRRPRLDSLHLEHAGVKTSDGRLVVSPCLQTTAAHIWAAGDITDMAPFTHVASAQAKLALRNAFAAAAEPFNRSGIPWATYTYPALAHVGVTEQEMEREGRPCRTLAIDFDEITRNVLTRQETGRYKIVVDPEGRILGGHILGNHADELLAPLILAIRHGLTIDQLADTIFPYPTMSEAGQWAATKFEGPASLPSDVECSARPCEGEP
jgi:pyruvate/2-oxoglutarate dehydrogenase complex dihydrolipoamide dehydrogenase (E3) component